MDNFTVFSQFQTQSKKGILVIFFSNLYKFLKITWILLFLFIKRFSNFSEITLFYIYIGFAFILLSFLIFSYFIFKNFQFKIENNHFILKKGVFKKSLISIPFDRIQNINFKQNIIQQIINTNEVVIETAGSAKAEISIKSMSLIQANALKDALTNYSKVLDNNDLKIKNKPFLIIDFSQLLKESLTENHLQSLFLVAAFILGIYQQIADIFKSFSEENQIDSFISEQSSAIEKSVYVIFGITFLLFLVAITSSFVRILLMHFNQMVFIKRDTIEISQGLTTKKSVVLKKNKVQFITISTNPLKKILETFSVRFAQAISGKVNQKQSKIIKIIGCKNFHLDSIKNLLFPEENLSELNKNFSDIYYKSRLYFRTSFLLIPINLLFYFGFESPLFFLANLLIIPFFIFLIDKKFKKRYYLFSNELLQINNGLIETHVTFLPFFKVQNIKLKQTIFQERKNVADLVFQTASGKIKIPCIQMHFAQKLYDYTIFKIETSQQSWM